MLRQIVVKGQYFGTADHSRRFLRARVAPLVRSQLNSVSCRHLRTSSRGKVIITCQSDARRAYESSKGSVTTTSAAQVAEAATTTDGAAEPAVPELPYVAPTDSQKFWTGFKLAFALPWRRFKKGSVLSFKLAGAISDMQQGRFGSANSVPQICMALRKAAVDPRVAGICVEIGPLAIGWAKAQEIRRHLEYFRASGKFSVVYMKQGAEKEYYLATAFEELYIAPSANVSLRGFTVSGTFLRGVLDKVGVEPQVRRIGAYKSAGDQLLRRDMSDAQREQLSAILDDIYEEFVETTAKARGKTREDMERVLNGDDVLEPKELLEGGWVDGLKYADEIEDSLKPRTGGKEDQLPKVALRKYASVGEGAFGFRGKKTVAVLRVGGAILDSASSGLGGGGSTITPASLIPKLRALKDDKNIAAVVLRVDSPGGSALASDLMWREIQVLSKKKPVIASMGDVAASGGYYLSMAASKVVAEPLTITGSIGVVAGKFNLKTLYERIGYAKETLSRGTFADSLNDYRSFTPEEDALFSRLADTAYAEFRDKAAESRGMEVEKMQAVAQGRVWTGRRALGGGLVDELGGLNKAISLARKAAGIPDKEKVTVREMSRQSGLMGLMSSPAAAAALFLASLAASLAPGAAAAASGPLVLLRQAQALQSAGAGGAWEALATPLAGLPLGGLMNLSSGRPQYLMTDVDMHDLLGGANAGREQEGTDGLL